MHELWNISFCISLLYFGAFYMEVYADSLHLWDCLMWPFMELQELYLAAQFWLLAVEVSAVMLHSSLLFNTKWTKKTTKQNKEKSNKFETKLSRFNKKGVVNGNFRRK